MSQQTVRRAIGVLKTACRRLVKSAEIQAVSTERKTASLERRSKPSRVTDGPAECHC